MFESGKMYTITSLMDNAQKNCKCQLCYQYSKRKGCYIRHNYLTDNTLFL
jgi:hypothetical protein